MADKQKICVVCGHSLATHIDEGDHWRCHSLGPDGYQCECILRKDRAEDDLSYYNYEERAARRADELDEEIKNLEELMDE